MQVNQIPDCPPPGVNGAAPVVAHPAVPGQGVGILTIDRDDGALREVWLPAYRDELATVEFLMAGARRSVTRGSDAAFFRMHHACCIVRSELNRTVDAVLRRGGLLHLVP